MQKIYIPLSIENDKKQLKVSIDYEKGGINYMSGRTNARGIYVYFRSVEVTKCEGYSTESFVMFGEKKDCKVLLQETGRESKKLTGEYAEKILAFDKKDILDWYNDRNTENSFSLFIKEFVK